MKSFFISGALLFLLSSCQKELTNPSSPITADNIKPWKLTGYNYYYYDTATNLITDSLRVHISYSPDQTRLFIIQPSDSSLYFRCNYNSSGYLTAYTYYSRTASPPDTVRTMTFIRNSSNMLQQLNYLNLVSAIPASGYFTINQTPRGNVITYMDTLHTTLDKEYFDVQFDSEGKPITKINKSSLVDPFDDYSSYSDGSDSYTYDNNKNLVGYLNIDSTVALHSLDSTIITYIRDQSGNNVLFDYFNALYGKDLTVWFSKSGLFHDNILNSSDYYNFGKPCNSITIRYKNYVNGQLTLNETDLYTFQNQYDSNGNLSGYIEKENGKTVEKWGFIYKRL